MGPETDPRYEVVLQTDRFAHTSLSVCGVYLLDVRSTIYKQKRKGVYQLRIPTKTLFTVHNNY